MYFVHLSKLCPSSNEILNCFKIDFSLSSQVLHSWDSGDKAFCTVLCCFYLEGIWLKCTALPGVSDSPVLAFFGKEGWWVLLKGRLQLLQHCLDLHGVAQVRYRLHPCSIVHIFWCPHILPGAWGEVQCAAEGLGCEEGGKFLAAWCRGFHKNWAASRSICWLDCWEAN